MSHRYSVFIIFARENFWMNLEIWEYEIYYYYYIVISFTKKITIFRCNSVDPGHVKM